MAKDFLVFVYGTLRRGESRNEMFLGNDELLLPEAYIAGFTMIDLGAFPALLEGPADSLIRGEVYRVSPKTFQNLDRLEGCDLLHPENSLYLREEVDIYGPDEEPTVLSAWVYILADQERGKKYRAVASGDWLRHRGLAPRTQKLSR